MSWQTYVDQNLKGTGMVSQAAIAGHDGSIWATSSEFSPTREEITTILKTIESGIPESIHVCGNKYLTLRIDKDKGILYGRKGPEGVACCITKRALIIGMYSEGMQAGACNNIVENLGDYLVANGY